jgi:hypothetical protein
MGVGLSGCEEGYIDVVPSFMNVRNSKFAYPYVLWHGAEPYAGRM